VKVTVPSVEISLNEFRALFSRVSGYRHSLQNAPSYLLSVIKERDCHVYTEDS